LSAAADEVARGMVRGIGGHDLATRARAAFLARMPAAPKQPPVNLKITFDEPNRRVVAHTTWDIETAFGRRSYDLVGDARLQPVRQTRR
jgi:hypothetical protein